MIQPICNTCGAELHTNVYHVGGHGDLTFWDCRNADVTGDWEKYIAHTHRQVTDNEIEALRAGRLRWGGDSVEQLCRCSDGASGQRLQPGP